MFPGNSAASEEARRLSTAQIWHDLSHRSGSCGRKRIPDLARISARSQMTGIPL
jgi:hypothetical protein